MNKVYKVIQHQAADPEYDNQTIYIYDNIEATVENIASMIEDEGIYSTEIFHYTKADEA